uniref:Uncharacterized protein n=1 Tax=Knipowitschia caucasica TaxID=637954 RepID=A0AAV2M3G2_KNICA
MFWWSEWCSAAHLGLNVRSDDTRTAVRDVHPPAPPELARTPGSLPFCPRCVLSPLLPHAGCCPHPARVPFPSSPAPYPPCLPSLPPAVWPLLVIGARVRRLLLAASCLPSLFLCSWPLNLLCVPPPLEPPLLRCFRFLVTLPDPLLRLEGPSSCPRPSFAGFGPSLGPSDSAMSCF